MSQARIDVISIGTLSYNLLWNETAPVRTPHATCTLVRSDKRNILIDPGLPGIVIGQRLFERTGLRAEQIDTVFLTNTRPAHRHGLSVFTHAEVLTHELEREAAIAHLTDLLDNTDDEDARKIEAELATVKKFKPADDKIGRQIDLFPLFGYTVGTCGLLVSAATQTILIAGDAVATQEHLLAGQVLPNSHNLDAAKESLREVYDIADVVIPGHDNAFVNPRAYGL
ncbi:MAG TPA: MBL fold metallo-hydrolase [Tepidisphaeraceae bacterium]|jgi:glyoxylase-like metal-dependent hydrolase (beta-lactamase superfamily II)